MSTYDNDLRLEEITTGAQSGTWGDTTNVNLELIAEAFSYGTEAISGTTHDTIIADGVSDPGRSMYLKYTGSLSSACTISLLPNTVSKVWIIENATSGSQNIIISQGSGANVTIANGKTKVVYTDGAGSGAAVYDAFANLATGSTLTVGAGVAEDTKIVFDGNAQDFYIGLDDSVDDLIIGKGSVVGTTPAITIDENLNVAVAGTVDGRDLATDGTKLDGIEAGATTDMTNAEIRSAVEAASDSNVFTDADHTKLNGIAANATNVTNNNQLTNGAGYVTSSGVTSIATSSFLTGGTITSSGTVSVSSNFHASTSSGDNFINAYGLRFSSFPGATEDSVIYLLDKPATTSPTSSDRYIVYDSSGSSIGVNLPGSGSFYPVGDNSDDLGKSGNRWDDIFATNNQINTSDQNEKNTIQDLSHGLNFIDQLTPRSFKYNSGSSDRTHFGLIAQEVKTVLDNNSISTDDFAAYIEPEEGPLGLRYGELIPILIKSIQELKAKVDALENA